jgi:hypothetical protein
LSPCLWRAASPVCETPHGDGIEGGEKKGRTGGRQEEQEGGRRSRRAVWKKEMDKGWVQGKGKAGKGIEENQRRVETGKGYWQSCPEGTGTPEVLEWCPSPSWPYG